MTQPNLSWTIHGNDQLSQVLEKLDRVAGKLDKTLDRLADGAKQAGSALDHAETRARQFGEGVEDAGRKVERHEEQLRALGDRAKDYGSRVAAALTIAATAVAGFGTALGIEKSKVDALLGAQLGLSEAEAKQLGEVTGEVYARGFTQSLAEAATAVRVTIQSGIIDPAAGTDAVEKMAGRTAALALMMEDDVRRVATAVSRMLRTGLVKSAEEAFDLITAATIAGADDRQDLLDTLTEYSVQFQALGIDGKKALGLISQALAAGARDSDTAADAIKEFAIRSKDGSVLSAKAFTDLGLDAKTMFNTFATGGPAADKAMKQVIDRLKAMEDPVKRDAAAVALFGTKAEDLQASLYAMDPTTAVAALGQVTGASDKFIKAQESTGGRLEQIWRKSTTSLSNFFEPALDAVLDKFDEFKADPEVQAWLDDLGAELKEIGEKWLPVLSSAAGDFFTMVKENKEEITLALKVIATTVALLATGFWVLATVSMDVGAAVVRAFTWVADQVNGVIDGLLTGAAKALGWIPGIGDDLKTASADFKAFRERVNEELGLIKNREIIVGVKVGSAVMAAATEVAGVRASGGPVWPGEIYEWQEQGRTYMSSGSGGRIISEHDRRSMGSGGGGEILGVLRVDHYDVDGNKVREELLTLKRNRGMASLGLG